MTVAGAAFGLLALTRAARRALERGDREELARLMDEADEQCGRMIDAMPPDPARPR